MAETELCYVTGKCVPKVISIYIYVENYDVKCCIPEVISGLKYIQNFTYLLLFVLYEMLRNFEVYC